MPRGAGAAAGRGPPGTVAAGRGACRGVGDRAGALVHSAGLRKEVYSAPVADGTPRGFTHSHRAPLQKEDRVVSHPEYHGHRATALHIRGP